MKLSFQYKCVSFGRKDDTKRPAIPVKFYNNKTGKSAFETIMLLDSGADITVIPLDWAEILDLKLEPRNELIDGIGGKVAVYDSFAKIEIKKRTKSFGQIRIPVMVPQDRDTDYQLLGRAGFFDNFIINIDEFQCKVTLQKKFPRLVYV